MLDELLEIRPDFEPDRKFVEELKKDMLEKADFMARSEGRPRKTAWPAYGKFCDKISFVSKAHLSYNKKNTHSSILSSDNRITNHMKDQNENVPKVSSESPPRPGRGGDDFGRQVLKFGVSLGGILVFIICVAAVSVWQGRSGVRMPGTGGGHTALSSKVLISSVGDNAFGSLAGLSADSSAKEDTAGTYAQGEGEASGAGAASRQNSIAAAAAGEEKNAVSDGVTVYPYVPTYYAYEYEGGEFSQNEAKMDVLKRVPGTSSGVAASTIANSLDFSLFDLGKLNNAKTSHLSFFEDREYGYRTDIDLANGSVSIYKDYDKWPNHYADCRNEECYKGLGLTVDDIPGDEAMIGAADAFLADYRIDMSAYGASEVDRGFMDYYEGAENIYVPEEISVVYPLVVDGKKVYGSYGDLNGLRVNYDIRSRRVAGMYSLTTHNYQSSAYDAETDAAKIIAAAASSGYGGAMPLRAGGGTGTEYKTVSIALDTPFLGYASMYRYGNNESSEYLVPCMVFPVKGGSDAPAYYRKRVIVPLIKDFLRDYQEGYPVIMKEGTASGGTAADAAEGSVPAIMAVP